MKLLITDKATPKNWVRLAYKAFQMKIPFDSGGMDVTTRRIYKEGSNQLVESHAKKVHEMEKWEDNPFKAMKLVQIGSERIATNGNRSSWKYRLYKVQGVQRKQTM